MGREARFQQMAARRQQGAAAKMQQTLASLPIPPVIDRMGVELQVGDLVLYDTPLTPIFNVADLKPDLRPGVPRGAMVMHLVASFPVFVGAGQPIAQMVVVGTSKAMAEAVGESDGRSDQPEAATAAPAGSDGASGETGGRDADVGGDDPGRDAAPGRVGLVDGDGRPLGESGRV